MCAQHVRLLNSLLLISFGFRTRKAFERHTRETAAGPDFTLRNDDANDFRVSYRFLGPCLKFWHSTGSHRGHEERSGTVSCPDHRPPLGYETSASISSTVICVTNYPSIQYYALHTVKISPSSHRHERRHALTRTLPQHLRPHDRRSHHLQCNIHALRHCRHALESSAVRVSLHKLRESDGTGISVVAVLEVSLCPKPLILGLLLERRGAWEVIVDGDEGVNCLEVPCRRTKSLTYPLLVHSYGGREARLAQEAKEGVQNAAGTAKEGLQNAASTAKVEVKKATS